MISAAELANHSFRMLREDGTVAALSLLFLPDGRLFGSASLNETYWSVVGDALELLDAQRRVTSRFTVVTRGKTGRRLESDSLNGARRHVLEELARPVQPDFSRRSGTGNPVAVMVRSHFINDRVLELLRHLDKGRRGFDLFLTFDETNGKPEAALPNLLPHSARRCSEIGLTQKQDRLLWWCGDFPFYFALLDIPNYQFYVMVEYDVYLTDQDATLLNAFAETLVSEKQGRVDGVVTRLRRERPQQEHRLYASAFAQFAITYSSFFPFVALSKPAAHYLYAQRKLEALLRPEAAVHCEAFLPSHLLAAGFKCADLDSVLPGSYRMDLMIMSGRQHGMPRSMVEGFEGFARMLHPVYDDAEFLQRMLDRCQADRQKEWLKARFDDGEFNAIPASVRAPFRARLP
jgi:hypothetical protein